VCKSGSIFPKTVVFDPFFPEISGIFGDSGDFPGKNFPEIGEFSGGIFPEDFAEIGCIFACTRKKPGKNRPFFPGIPRGFPGGFSGDFPGTFFGKNPDFPGFSPRFTDVYTVPQRAFWKKPPNFRKSSRDFQNSRESPEKISRNSRKFRPTGFRGKFSGFS
jgi:hypothetical protein